MTHDHEIFLSVNKVCCTCGYSQETRTYTEALKLARKHGTATPQRSAIIKPLAKG